MFSSVEADNCNQSVNNKQANYGSIESTPNNNNNQKEPPQEADDGQGWLRKASSGIYNLSAGAVSAGFDGVKWAVASTVGVGSVVVSKGCDGVDYLRGKNKDKDD